MVAAVLWLAANDAVLGADEQQRATFRTPSGQVIDGQTVKALARRAIARTAGPSRDRFTLTQAGRRLAQTLTAPNLTA